MNINGEQYLIDGKHVWIKPLDWDPNGDNPEPIKLYELYIDLELIATYFTAEFALTDARRKIEANEVRK